MKTGTVIYVVKATVRDWLEDNSLRLGAALSYYTIFSIAPLLIILIAIAGLAFGNDYARVQILKQLEGLIGTQGAAAVGEMLQNANQSRTGILATILGFLTIIFGATGVVTELKSALNTIWEIDSGDGIKRAVQDRARSLALVLGIGFLLLVSLVLSAGLTAISEHYGGAVMLQAMNILISVAVITVLFAFIFKYLPDAQVQWRNVWIGAFVTSILFTIGKTLTALYIAKSSVASSYGAAGSLVIILLWVYYNSQILFLGAEFTQVYSKLRGDSPTTSEDEEKEDPEDKIERRKAESEIRQEETMESQSAQKERSALEKAAYLAGYELGKLETAKKDFRKKARIGKWIYRVVQVLGVKTSAKLGWKGYKLKKKLDDKDEAA
jgi:membrane protein